MLIKNMMNSPLFIAICIFYCLGPIGVMVYGGIACLWLIVGFIIFDFCAGFRDAIVALLYQPFEESLPMLIVYIAYGAMIILLTEPLSGQYQATRLPKTIFAELADAHV